MDIEGRSMLNASVEFLKKLHFKAEDIMVTGSIALDMQGLKPRNRKVHDVDLLVKMDDQTWRCLKLLEAISMSDEEKNDNMYPGRKDIVIFKCHYKNMNFVINIWKNDWNEGSSLKDWETGIRVATAWHIIQAKKRYNREKDVRDINAIIKQILDR